MMLMMRVVMHVQHIKQRGTAAGSAIPLWCW
eukprot:COSAG01_NODE_2402_length_7759_cov_9.960313_3_plen_31_part_00